MKQVHGSRLNKGKFGFVYLSIWKNKLVAIKRPHNNSRAIELFKQEVTIHRELKHPNIVNFLAVLNEVEPEALILDFIVTGDLFDMMVKAKIPYTKQLSIALDIAKGLGYLHNLQVIHRDLKLENILIDTCKGVTSAKICDFGLSASLDSSDVFNEICGTTGYVAPEIFQHESPYPYSKNSDIYAYAQIAWALTSRATPFPNARTLKQYSQLVIAGKRNKILQSTPIDFAVLITAGWSQNPNDRPSMVEIIDRLVSIIEHSPPLSIDDVEHTVEPENKSTKTEIEISYDILFDSIDNLRLYGHLLLEKERTIAGKKTIQLANNIQSVLDALKASTLNDSDAEKK